MVYIYVYKRISTKSCTKTILFSNYSYFDKWIDSIDLNLNLNLFFVFAIKIDKDWFKIDLIYWIIRKKHHLKHHFAPKSMFQIVDSCNIKWWKWENFESKTEFPLHYRYRDEVTKNSFSSVQFEVSSSECEKFI